MRKKFVNLFDLMLWKSMNLYCNTAASERGDLMLGFRLQLIWALFWIEILCSDLARFLYWSIMHGLIWKITSPSVQLLTKFDGNLLAVFEVYKKHLAYFLWTWCSCFKIYLLSYTFLYLCRFWIVIFIQLKEDLLRNEERLRWERKQNHDAGCSVPGFWHHLNIFLNR